VSGAAGAAGVSAKRGRAAKATAAATATVASSASVSGTIETLPWQAKAGRVKAEAASATASAVLSIGCGPLQVRASTATTECFDASEGGISAWPSCMNP